MAPPPNDNFATALALIGNSGNADSDNTDATSQTPEPIVDDHGNGIHTVWYSFTTSEEFTSLDLWTEAQPGGPGLTDTAMAVYTGASLGALTEIAFNDDALIDPIHTSGAYSEIDRLVLEADVTYWIVVTGYSDSDFGAFRLSWALTVDPCNYVLKADGSSADAFVTLDDWGGPETDVWITYKLGLTAEAIALWATSGTGGSVTIDALGSGFSGLDMNDPDGTLWQTGKGGGSSPDPVVGWQLVELHWNPDVITELFIDGVTVYSSAWVGLPGGTLSGLALGVIFGSPNAAGGVLYIDDVKAGTTRGGSDVFADSFLGGTLDAWTSTTGDVSVVCDPFAVTGIQGVCVAFNDTALEPNPTWTRLDDPEQDWRLRVSSHTIDRGKSNELDTTKTGTAAITFHDPDGILDPTNTTGPFYGLINPNVQVAIARWNPVTETWSTRFRGFAKQWSYQMDTSGFSTVTLEAVDLFELLADLLLTPGDQGNTPPTGAEGDIYYEGGSTVPARDVFKHVDQRILQVLDDAGIPGFWRGEFATPVGIFSGNVTVQEQTIERLGQALEALFAAADAEFPGVANLFCRREGWIQFFGRYARFFPDRPGYGIGEWDVGGAAEAEADANVVRLTSFTFRRSKDDIYNVALALPQGLEDGDVPGQQVEDATSIAKYGRRPWFADDLLTWEGHNDDASTTTAAVETKKFATYRVDNYKEPKNRIEQITFRMLRVDHFSGSAVWAFLCGVEIGDVLNVETTHRGGGGFDEPCYVEGIREVDEPLDGTMHNVTMQIDVSPKSYFDSNPFGEVDEGDTS